MDLPSLKVIDELIALASGSVDILWLAAGSVHIWHQYLGNTFETEKNRLGCNLPGTTGNKTVDEPIATGHQRCSGYCGQSSKHGENDGGGETHCIR